MTTAESRLLMMVTERLHSIDRHGELSEGQADALLMAAYAALALCHDEERDALEIAIRLFVLQPPTTTIRPDHSSAA